VILRFAFSAGLCHSPQLALFRVKPLHTAIKLLQATVRSLSLASCLALADGAVADVEPPSNEALLDEPLFELIDAYKGNQQYFLRYRRGASLFYAAGDLATPPPGADPQPGQDYDVPVVEVINRNKVESWEDLTRNMTPIPVLSVDDWAALRNRLFADLMSKESNQGIAVSFDRLDYFFFYDQAGNFRARRLIEKPPWYSVSAHIDLKQHFDGWIPVLAEFLASKEIQSEDVIFSTGDLDQGAIPFLYINTRNKAIVLIQADDLPENVIGSVPYGHVLQTVWHFMESHSYGIIMRPFSSVRNLVAVISDTAVETGRSLLTDMRFSGPIPPLSQSPPMDLVEWERYLDEQLGRGPSRGKLKFLVDGSAFFPRFVDAVTSADSSVDIRAYIFDNDDVAMEIAELLKRRSREGIKIRVLFDGLGSLTASGEQSTTLPDDHRPPRSIESHLKHDSKVKVRVISNPWLTGDHVKTMVVDDQLAFVGGMNIGREYRYDWHDMMVEVTGPVVDDITREYNRAWGQAGFWGDFSILFNWPRKSVNEEQGGYPVRLLHTSPARHEIFRLQREAIARSRSYVYIENAYFTEDSLLRELIKARRRGVDVRVIIPLETDRGLITRNIAMAANIMLANGIRVYLYPGFSHAKAAVFDGWASLGSANLDRLSLKINKEINLATSEPEAVQALIRELFEPDFAGSAELTEPFPERWTDHIIEIFGDYIF
jgi:cardiolipin synthase